MSFKNRTVCRNKFKLIYWKQKLIFCSSSYKNRKGRLINLMNIKKVKLKTTSKKWNKIKSKVINHKKILLILSYLIFKILQKNMMMQGPTKLYANPWNNNSNNNMASCSLVYHQSRSPKNHNQENFFKSKIKALFAIWMIIIKLKNLILALSKYKNVINY